MVRHDKTGVESHTELSDDTVAGAALQIDIGVLEGVFELTGARLSDCAQVVDDFVSRHTCARVENGDGALLRVRGDLDLKVVAVAIRGLRPTRVCETLLLEGI